MGRRPLEEEDRIDKEKIPSAINALKQLQPKELPDVSTREAIRQMRRYIDGALKKNYTYDEISDVLRGLDIHVSGSRLKYLLSEIKKNTRTRKKNKTNTLEQDAVEEDSSKSENQGVDEPGELISNGSSQKLKSNQSVKSKKVKRQTVKTSGVNSSEINGHTNEPQVYDDDDL